MLNGITNFLAISPDLGTAGQPTAQQLRAVQAAGYELVINLVPATSSEALADEAALVTALGMRYLHIPVIWDAPARAELERFFDALDQNRECKVFVHCVLNFRVSTFVFLYRVLRQGTRLELARQAMHKIWEPNPIWQRFIQEQLQPRDGQAPDHSSSGEPTAGETTDTYQ